MHLLLWQSDEGWKEQLDGIGITEIMLFKNYWMEHVFTFSHFHFLRHAEVMKKIIETVAEGGGELGVHMYPFYNQTFFSIKENKGLGNNAIYFLFSQILSHLYYYK